ncbi:MAG: hypothetical protein IKQ67_07340 [Candidatus Methanomethylophilaceae archaeon]|nr:hypothetical protein [Candidatus Methanomethylophilaceae archaeon]
MAWFLPILSAIGTAIGGIFTFVDLQNAQSMEDSMTQMEAYMAMLENRMTLDEFIGEVWPSLLLIFGIILAGYIVATPKRRYRV